MSMIKSIEQNIYDVENESERQIKNNESMVKKYQELIQKQKELYAETIYKHAEEMMKSCNDVDNQMIQFIPDDELQPDKIIDKINHDSDIFNPVNVVEFKNNSVSRIDTWDKSKGLFPNVVMQYKYSIGVKGIPFCEYVFSKQEGEMEFSYNFRKVIVFYVDNYLNLYHPESGLYLMFNKLPFPQYSFDLRFKDYGEHMVFLNGYEAHTDITCDILDKPFEHLDVIDKFIPVNLSAVIEYFGKFRKVSGFKVNEDTFKQLFDEFNGKSRYDVYVYQESENLEQHESTEQLDDGLDELLQTAINTELISDMMEEINDIYLSKESHVNKIVPSDSTDLPQSDDDELIMY